MQSEVFEMVKLIADKGKVFMRKSDGLVLSDLLYLGKEDSADNYEEVDAPEEPEAENV